SEVNKQSIRCWNKHQEMYMKTPTVASRVLVILLGLSSLLGIVGCKEEAHHKDLGSLAVTKPWRQDVTVEQTYVAQIRAIQHIEIRAFEKGYLQNIYVDEGQLIKKGQKMFQIMPVLVQAEFDKSKAEFEIASIEYNQTVTLAKKKV